MAATFCALSQFIAMGRQGWLEPIFGLDRLAIFHRRNGIATLCLVLLHPTMIAAGYGILSDQDIITQAIQLESWPYVILASIAVVLLIITVGASIYIVRKHLKFETWYFVHLANYAAVLLFAWHQFANGSDLNSNPAFMYYWLGIYTFAALNILIWRWIKPFAQSYYFDFKVEKVTAETPTTANVYITGRHLEKFKARGGQFVMVRFLAKGLTLQEHPFSLSMLPSKEHIRLTIRALGDFTNQMPGLRAGTKVVVSGPHGAFTHDLEVKAKVVYIAGGIGITPIRSLIEERTLQSVPGSSILLFGNKSLGDTALLSELEELGEKIKMPIYNVLSEQTDYKGEKGYVDGEKISRLVPDVKERDVFLCGPPPMMAGVVAALKKLGVPASQIHYERFSLHKQ
jgi:predicted ferric reductase